MKFLEKNFKETFFSDPLKFTLEVSEMEKIKINDRHVSEA